MAFSLANLKNLNIKEILTVLFGFVFVVLTFVAFAALRKEKPDLKSAQRAFMGMNTMAIFIIGYVAGTQLTNVINRAKIENEYIAMVGVALVIMMLAMKQSTAIAKQIDNATVDKDILDSAKKTSGMLFGLAFLGAGYVVYQSVNKYGVEGLQARFGFSPATASA